MTLLSRIVIPENQAAEPAPIYYKGKKRGKQCKNNHRRGKKEGERCQANLNIEIKFKLKLKIKLFQYARVSKTTFKMIRMIGWTFNDVDFW